MNHYSYNILDWCLSEQWKLAGVRRFRQHYQDFWQTRVKDRQDFWRRSFRQRITFHFWCHTLLRFCLLFNLFKIFFPTSHIHYWFENILDEIYCVRWNPSCDMIASSSYDKTAKLLDFKTGKVLNTGTTSDGSNYPPTNIN
jgi:WD40 repeat protein